MADQPDSGIQPGRLHGLYATVFAPFWYGCWARALARSAEISTAMGVVPDMLTLGDGTFIADAVMLGDEEIDGGWMTLRPRKSARSFVGNGAYRADGTTLPERCADWRAIACRPMARCEPATPGWARLRCTCRAGGGGFADT